MYLWLKLLHVFFTIMWFAGLFALPRLLVNLSQLTTGTVEYQRLLAMASKLMRYMTPMGILALLFGLLTVIVGHFWSGWAHSKITLGVVLLGYHFYSWRLLQDFREGRSAYSQRWYRIYSEVPIVMMALALYLAVFKPF
ncbi:CopD family protein [Vitreoscilla massiliensis]|uniref:Protoporphyrinogen IX oxidase n=1 Tax=Vitreoscilla massiliensis TaxID=1689272 RepID=A0ABY4E7W9_9NEIS|nr:CopD family protein [Vitreoscilla massiliensis]UOO90990.1 CopD family protein [Vitreoscilla massiliensis]